MRKMRRSILALATLVFTLGGVSTGVALVQIYQMNDFQKSINIENSKLDAPQPTQSKFTPIKLGEIIGVISIPKLAETYPIVQGTDDKDLKLGVGHYVDSVMPGVKDNSVLSGHRDSVFSKLGQLKKGDLVIVRTSSGTFTYQVRKSWIVLANDRTVIVPTPTATLTLTTCYPFFYIGSAPKRFIVSADLVQN
jgi:sortase A